MKNFIEKSKVTSKSPRVIRGVFTLSTGDTIRYEVGKWGTRLFGADKEIIKNVRQIANKFIPQN